MRIVFMGTPDYATAIFEELLKNDIEVVALFTQPDKPVGRKQILTAPHIKQFCIENGLSIPVYQPKTLKETVIQQTIKELKPDFIIVAAYGQILPKEILNIAPCINLHASLLPKYRGASPIQESLLNDDEFSGVTAMLMDEGLDSGEILGLRYVKIHPNMDVSELFGVLSTCAADLTISILKRFNDIQPKTQDIKEVSHCKKIKKENGKIQFDNAKEIYLKYRAYKYWPGLFLESGLKLKELELNDTDSQNGSGEILKIKDDYIVIGCSKGSLKIKSVQPPSKKAMLTVDYIRGKRLSVGDNIF